MLDLWENLTFDYNIDFVTSLLKLITAVIVGVFSIWAGVLGIRVFKNKKKDRDERNTNKTKVVMKENINGHITTHVTTVCRDQNVFYSHGTQNREQMTTPQKDPNSSMEMDIPNRSNIGCWMLIESSPHFGTPLRKLLYKLLGERGIIEQNIRDPFKSDEKEKTVEGVITQMVNHLKQFVSDDKKIAFCCFPKEPNFGSVENMNNFFKDLNKNNKYIVCFESGFSLKDKYDHLRKKSWKSRIIVIHTKHEEYAKGIFDYLEKNVLNKSDSNHLVFIFGPHGSRAAEMRKDEFMKHCKEKLAGLIIEPEDKDQPNKNVKETFNPGKTVITRFTLSHKGTWQQEVTQRIISELIDRVDIEDDTIFTSFICANDSVALGVLEAIKLRFKSQNSGRPKRIALIGFDGVAEFVKYLDGERFFINSTNEIKIKGATYKVSFDEYYNNARDITDKVIRDSEDINTDIEVSADLYPSVYKVV